jgi:hypothetical protein
MVGTIIIVVRVGFQRNFVQTAQWLNINLSSAGSVQIAGIRRLGSH